MGDTVGASHLEDVYTKKKGEREVSWFQENPEPSLELIALAGGTPESAIVDVGGGASRLVDALVAKGFRDVSVLDLSPTALARAQTRLGGRAAAVAWIVADVTTWKPARQYDLWHDRAAFHFLTGRDRQAAYVETLRKALRSGGGAVIGTFGPEGPETCSGLPVARYDAESLGAVLGSGFSLLHTRRHDHAAPWGAVQRFQFSIFRYRP